MRNEMTEETGIIFAGAGDIVYPKAIEVPEIFDWPGGEAVKKIPGFRTIVDDTATSADRQ